MMGQANNSAWALSSKSIEPLYPCMVTVDARGLITWISDDYYRFLELTESPVGKHISDIVQNSYLPDVTESGKPVFLDLLYIKNRWVIVNVLPLLDDKSQVIGGIGFIAADNLDEIRALVSKYNRLLERQSDLPAKFTGERKAQHSFSHIIGHSDALEVVRQQLKKAAKFDISVLLTGETGTGKELFAHALHNLSISAGGPFVSVNMAAIPENLMEAELFGAAPGAYTGVGKQGRMGKFELADGGTLFLDEIGDMPHELQAKLLRVLQERQFERLGCNRLHKVNVRIVAATSKNLLARVSRGQFRADLYYRLSPFPIHLPPLRERIEDIGELCEHFLSEICQQYGITQKSLLSDGLELLSRHHWPGNIRELYNLMERSCVLNECNALGTAQLAPLLEVYQSDEKTDSGLSKTNLTQKIIPLAEALTEYERKVIAGALDYTGGEKSRAAELLGISRATLYAKLKK